MSSFEEIREKATIPLWPDAARDVLGVSKNTAYRLAKEGVIPTLRLGRKIVVPVPALLRWLEAEAPAGVADGN